ncbi:MAG: bifunctional folylpolyglutamate synthase/dihydrofolate synthase [Bacteroidia bacterium]|nr:bifunctional folylpolyglutamate synthase/dihydrofolate synthase [Bacteroidia bacterium]
MNTYSEALQYLYDRLPVFHHIGGAAYKPGLDNTIKLLNAFDNPQQKFKCIHIAGTNGKGSVSNMLSAVFQSAGYKTGLYTSPHLVDFGERIRVDGQMIAQNYVIEFVKKHQSVFDEIQPSFFEATMAMAFCYFADKQVDIAIIETGLGGRLDSTNIVIPLLSVITNISFDHVAFLGDTLEKIAFEKAGIIKTGIPVIVGEWLPETKPVFEKTASEKNAPIYFAEETFDKYYIENQKFVIESSIGKIVSDLSGKYQLRNLSTVLKSLEVFRANYSNDFTIDNKKILHGLENVCTLTGLQGRWQTLQSKPKVITDTGHNEAGIAFVCEQLQQQNFETLRIVIGFANDKDISKILKLLPANAKYYFTQANVQRAMEADKLAEKALSVGLNGAYHNSVKESVKAAINEAAPEDLIFIGGSNFVVGEAIPLFEQ